MSNTPADQTLPKPAYRVSGQTTTEQPGMFRRLAKLFKPRFAQEEECCTVSRYAERLIDRVTGDAFSSDELGPLVIEMLSAFLTYSGTPVNAIVGQSAYNAFTVGKGVGFNVVARYVGVPASPLTLVLETGAGQTGTLSVVSETASTLTVNLAFHTVDGEKVITTTIQQLADFINTNSSLFNIVVSLAPDTPCISGSVIVADNGVNAVDGTPGSFGRLAINVSESSVTVYIATKDDTTTSQDGWVQIIPAPTA